MPSSLNGLFHQHHNPNHNNLIVYQRPVDYLSLIDYIINNVDDDTLDHLLFKCPSLLVHRIAHDIPDQVSNDNMKLLLGQTSVDSYRWNKILSFYTCIGSIRPDLHY